MGVQRLDEHSFIVDEAAKVGYCPVCDKDVSIEKFDLVHDARFYRDPLWVRWSTSCKRCGHRVECCLPYDEGFKWPGWSK